MNRHFFGFTALAACCLPALSAQAEATRFRIKPLIIKGDDNIEATAINSGGTIVGTLYAGITDAPSAIAISGNTVTALPLPQANYSALHPTSINAEGDILGWARGPFDGIAQMFLFQDGAYNQAYQEVVIEPGSNAQYLSPDAMGVSKTGKVFYNTIFGLSDPIGNHYGKPPHFRTVPEMNRFTVILSINDHGVVAGTSYSLSGIHAMFEGSGKDFVTITPPGSINTIGGFVNNSGAVAGSFKDASRAYHGFVYNGSAYTVFDMPVAAGTVTATGFNNKGRVVGTYTSASNGKIHCFLYNGSVVSSFGTFPSSETVSVAIGDGGGIVVNSQIPSEKPKYLSYAVYCTGTGC
jgi:probable HAF family extracellular repeat protein